MATESERKNSEAQELFEKVFSTDNLAAALLSSIGKEDAKEILSAASSRPSKKPKPSREAYNIQFAQGLSSEDMITLLQHELLRARTSDSEVTLPSSIVHDIKFRLVWYFKKHGEVDREPPKKVGTK